MRIALDSKPLHAEAQATHKRREKLTRDVWKKIREVSFVVEGKIKVEMPKDTGRAAGSWGHWTPGLIDMGRARGAGPHDAVWDEFPAELKIVQGSNVEYIPDLEAGHSKQRAAGFIERAEDHAQRVLDTKIDEILRHW